MSDYNAKHKASYSAAYLKTHFLLSNVRVMNTTSTMYSISEKINYMAGRMRTEVPNITMLKVNR